MDASRRTVMAAGLGAGLATLTAAGANAGRQHRSAASPATNPVYTQGDWATLDPTSFADQSHALQTLIDQHASNGTPLVLPPGKFYVADIHLRPGAKLFGTPGLTEFVFAGGDAFFSGQHAADISLVGLTFNGNTKSFSSNRVDALVALQGCLNVDVLDCTVRGSLYGGLAFDACSGRVQNTTLEDIRATSLFSRDSLGFDILHNDIRRSADNGIQIWRSAPGHDGSRVSNNRITDIAAKSGGSGQYGNGINVFRAGGVSVSDNTITKCAYSAVRGNAASNLQVLGNACDTIGEVALYAEFAFEGAMIANNLVSNAATGVSVANFNEGGRLATVTANLIRNLHRREFEPDDKRGVGIFVEADSVVSNNVIEGAPTVGLHLGWGRYRRDVLATQNIIRQSRIGIMISAEPGQGATVVSNNLISGSRLGSIRRAHFDTPTGPDLVSENGTTSDLTLSGNVAPARQS